MCGASSPQRRAERGRVRERRGGGVVRSRRAAVLVGAAATARRFSSRATSANASAADGRRSVTGCARTTRRSTSWRRTARRAPPTADEAAAAALRLAQRFHGLGAGQWLWVPRASSALRVEVEGAAGGGWWWGSAGRVELARSTPVAPARRQSALARLASRSTRPTPSCWSSFPADQGRPSLCARGRRVERVDAPPTASPPDRARRLARPGPAAGGARRGRGDDAPAARPGLPVTRRSTPRATRMPERARIAGPETTPLSHRIRRRP